MSFEPTVTDTSRIEIMSYSSTCDAFIHWSFKTYCKNNNL